MLGEFNNRCFVKGLVEEHYLGNYLQRVRIMQG